MFKADQLITADFEISAFRDLPVPFKKALAWYMIVDGDAWQDVLDNVNIDFEEASDMPASFIEEVDELYGDKRFVHGWESTDAIKILALTDPTFVDDQDMLDGTMQHAFQPLNERFPVVMADDLANDPSAQTIQDGWTRFATYITHGYDVTPIVFAEAAHHADLLDTLQRSAPRP